MTLAPKDFTKFFQKCAKAFHGSVYSAPMPQEVARAMEEGRFVHDDLAGEVQWAMLMTDTKRGSVRKSFTGESYVTPRGSAVLTHLAHLEGVTVPVPPVDVAYLYQEDPLTRELVAKKGWNLMAVRISPSSEVVGVYGKHGGVPAHQPADEPTLVRLRHEAFSLTARPEMMAMRADVLSEVNQLDSFRDDYPYYNRTGAWGNACLRGYRREDPLYGLKPSEMSRRWKAEHPDELSLTECEDTVLADRCPATMALLWAIESTWGQGLERVRFLRLTEGTLDRHCDITDRDLGTRDNQVCRIHIPLVTNDSVTSTCWGLDGKKTEAHLRPWEAYYCDIRKPHAASNQEGTPRIHLQVDVKADWRMRAAILSGEQIC